LIIIMDHLGGGGEADGEALLAGDEAEGERAADRAPKPDTPNRCIL